MKTVALVTSIAYSLPNFRGELIAELVRRGARVLALAPDYDARTSDRVRALGAMPITISLQRAGMRPDRDLLDLARLYAQLRRLHVDAVLGYFAKPVIYGGLAAAAAHIPRRIAMIEGLGYVFDESSGPPRGRRRVLRRVTETLYRAALARTHETLFLNHDDRDIFLRAGIVDADRARVIGAIGVNLDHFRPRPLVAGPVRFILMARMLREKGIEDFVVAARILKSAGRDFEAVLLGGIDPNPGGIDAELLAAWDREGVVRWRGHVDDVRDALASAHVAVLPSYYREGVPRSLQEAAAMGRAIITTDHVGCRDTVDRDVNGLLVPIRDPAALAAAMGRFITAPGLIAKMGAASRHIAEARFDARRTTTLLADLLLSARETHSPTVA